MANKLLFFYKFIIIILVLLVIYSCYVFNSKVKEQKAKWNIGNKSQINTSEWSMDSLQHWKIYGLTVKKVRNNEIEFITTSNDPVIISKELELTVDPAMTTVEVETNQKKIQLFWTSKENTTFTEDNSVVLNSPTGKFVYLIDTDVHVIRVDPAEEIDQKVIINKINVKKYAK